ncbi:ABC exporter membrane fusion protein [Chroococcidiopsis sp. CCMEE 29]|uniref:ABC exporter membrane fusion protein n=1 Tax=Chroococcidiopsis sp. CCMEE 29 TaxID=155894 RepID=UPI0020212A3D|nr:ABC exporter membrane fusion protein [Chroococcidiopsis sp. CCMEE 29]
MQGTIQNRNQFIKAISQQGVPIVGIILLGISGATTYGWMRMASVKQEAAAPVVTPVIQTVTALGQLEPRGTVIKLSAPTSSQGNRVERLLVQEGDHVQAGQIIAILDSHDQRKAAFEEAEEQVNVARAQLEVIKAGAKQGEINAQQAEIERLSAERQGNIAAQVATVARLQSELQNAQTEFNRYQSLYQEGAISASERDSRRLALDTAQKSVQEAQVTLDRIRSTTPQELNKARATLEQIAEVRPVEVRSAQAEVTRAIAARNQAKASFDQSVVRSPINGEVLDIHTQAGEVVSTDGIAEIGQTRQMQAIAEVYQSDISKVQVGQRVRVTSNSIPSELTGTVERVGSQVRRQAIVNTDPSANIDARVIEVQINLDDASSQKAAKFTNLQVQVVIEQ